jgi:hypothetical protein
MLAVMAPRVANGQLALKNWSWSRSNSAAWQRPASSSIGDRRQLSSSAVGEHAHGLSTHCAGTVAMRANAPRQPPTPPYAVPWHTLPKRYE